MPRYTVEQYEIWSQTYTVEAASRAEAVAKVLNGEAQADDNGAGCIEVATDLGMPRDQDDDLSTEELEAAGVDLSGDDCIIPSIRDVTAAE